MRSKLDNITILDIAFALLIVLSVFDQAREALPLSPKIMLLYAYSRDAIIFSLFVYYYCKKKVIIEYKQISFIISLLLLMSIVISVIVTGNGFGSAIKTLWLQIKHFLLFYILYNYLNHCKALQNLLKKIIIVGAILVVYNIITVLFFSSKLTRLLSGGKRLTVGNSSTISFLYFVFFLICINFKVFKNKYIDLFYSVFFLIAIITTVTTTALVALFPVVIIKYISLSSKRKLRYFSIILLALCLIPALLKQSKNDFLSYVMDKGVIQIKELVFSKDKKNVGTLSVREGQKQRITQNMQYYDYLLGLGSGGYQVYSDNLENFYYVLLLDYGFFSFVFFIGLIFFWFILSLLNKKYLEMELVLIFASYCYTLDFFLPYVTGFGFVLALALKKVAYEKNLYYLK